MHQCLSLSVKQRRTQKAKDTNVNKPIDKWKQIQFLILDEVSMIGPKMLEEITKNLMIANNNTDIFGGIHILFCGDYYQLPPVNSKALYERTDDEIVNGEKFKSNFTNIYTDVERQLWHNKKTNKRY